MQKDTNQSIPVAIAIVIQISTKYLDRQINPVQNNIMQHQLYSKPTTMTVSQVVQLKIMITIVIPRTHIRNQRVHHHKTVSIIRIIIIMHVTIIYHYLVLARVVYQPVTVASWLIQKFVEQIMKYRLALDQQHHIIAIHVVISYFQQF